MKVEIPTTKTVDIKFVQVILPLRLDRESMPEEFPLRQGDTWQATISVETGVVENWPQSETGEFYLKVANMGRYYLLDSDRNVVLSIDRDYVPHGIIPGRHGQHVWMIIDKTGKITNFPKKLDFSAFLGS